MDLKFTSQLAYGFTPIGFLENLEYEVTGELSVFQSHDVPAQSEGSLTLCPGQGCGTRCGVLKIWLIARIIPAEQTIT